MAGYLGKPNEGLSHMAQYPAFVGVAHSQMTALLGYSW